MHSVMADLSVHVTTNSEDDVAPAEEYSAPSLIWSTSVSNEKRRRFDDYASFGSLVLPCGSRTANSIRADTAPRCSTEFLAGSAVLAAQSNRESGGLCI